MNDLLDLFHLIKSHIPLIIIETKDEKNAISLVSNVGRSMKLNVFAWNLIQGYSIIDNTNKIYGGNLLEPNEILYTILNNRTPGVYILIDFHPYLENNQVIRLLKEISLNSENIQQTIVFISSEIKLPQDLKHYSTRFDLALPSNSEIKQYVGKIVNDWQNSNISNKINIDTEAIDSFVNNLKGLSYTEIKRLTHNALIDNAITEEDIPEISKAKYELLNKGNVLYFEHDSSSLNDVGGLKNLKKWLEKRRNIFLSNSTEITLDIPKGVLLVGVQGCGKSMASKAIAHSWGIPLLRLDFGTLFNKFYGETERKIREALSLADRMAPCVLWIDEIEKGLANDINDGGTGKRVLGTLLTWMSERKSRVFLVATSNNIQDLPPELLRKGRLDEIFFVDLPDKATRKIIYEIHLKKRALELTNIDLELIAEISNGFSGSEIEQVIVSSLYSMYSEESNLTTEVIIDEIKKTKPLSVIMSENINMMREWAKNRTVSAN